MRIVLMRSSCKMHDDHFLLVCFYRAPTELCKVLLGWCVGFHTLLVRFGLFSRSLEVVNCSADPWKFWPRSNLSTDLDLWIIYQFSKFFFIGIPGLVGFAFYVGVQKIVDWLMSLALTNGAIRCQGALKSKTS